MTKRKSVVERFWAKVDRRGDNDCWPWLGARNEHGYGHFVITSKKNVGAHRLALMLSNAPYPIGKPPTAHGWCALHRCDNPSCVNPHHLFWGTQPENNKDRMVKGRSGDHRGEAHGRAIISNEDVAAIRRSPLGSGDLARQYGINRGQVWKIRTGRAWSHL